MTSLPTWIKSDSLDKEALKSAVQSCGHGLKLMDTHQQKKGAEDLYDLIILAWSLETSIARDAADVICDESRCIVKYL